MRRLKKTPYARRSNLRECGVQKGHCSDRKFATTKQMKIFCNAMLLGIANSTGLADDGHTDLAGIAQLFFNGFCNILTEQAGL